MRPDAPEVNAQASSDGRPCVAILLGAPLSQQNLERTGVPYLTPHFNVVVLDCKPWLGRSETGLSHESAQWHAVESIGCAADLEAALRRHRPTHALDFVGLGPLTPSLQQVLAHCGTRFVVQKSGTLPQPSLWSRLAWKLRARKPAGTGMPADVGSAPASATGRANPLSRLVQRLESSLRLRRQLMAPDLALLAGSASLNHFTRKARQILWVGSQDYHLYHCAQADAMPGLPRGDYAVFIDDNLPYASDWSLLGIPAPVTPQRYYACLCNFFSRLEAQWGMPVVIAAHPSSRYDPRVEQSMGGRAVVHGRTLDLVRQAKAVLLHGSTAVSFAVLGQKPLLFLTSDELMRNTYGLHIQTMASELDQQPLNIDRNPDIAPLASLAAKSPACASYTEKYLYRSGTTEARAWDAFIDHVRKKCS